MEIKRNIFVLALAMAFIANIQLSAQTLTDEQRIEIQNRMKQKVEEFKSSLIKLTDKSLTAKARQMHSDLILKLFVGEGEPYDYYDYEHDKEMHSPGCKITYIRNGSKVKTQKLKDFIKKIGYLQTGFSSTFNVEAACVVFVDEVIRVGDHYECVAFYYDPFSNKIDSKGHVQGKKPKKIRYRINVIEIPDGEIVWDLKLDGIYIIENK